MYKFLAGLSLTLPVQALTIQVDYRFDTEGFFDAPGAKEAIEAAASRWGRIINQNLLAVNIQDDARNDVRFAPIHPATGKQIQMSAAASAGSDFLVEVGAPAADIYLDGFELAEDTWILFVGGRNMDDLGAAGPIGLGTNFDGVDTDPESLVNRGFNSGPDSLSVLGGSAAFSVNANWNFDLNDPSGAGGIDFYSIALHEIGHAFGLCSRSSPKWIELSSSGTYQGEAAISAFNADNVEVGEPMEVMLVNALELENPNGRDYHWKTGAQKSKIFQFGQPSRFGVVGSDELQPLLMDANLNLNAQYPRLEITNVEVGGLIDLGWSIISEDPPPPPELPLALERSVNGGIKLSLPTKVGSTYTIQTTTDGVSWLNVEPSITGDGETLNWEDGQEGFVDPNGNAIDLSGKFYRVIEN